MSNKSQHRATDISKILSKYERLLIFSAIAKVTCQIQIPAGMQNFQCTTKMPYCLLFLLYCALFCVFCTIFYCFFWLARHPRPINHHHDKAYFRSFSGVTSKQLDHYIIPSLVNGKPDAIIIHVGTNDSLYNAINEDIAWNINQDRF